jgi:hypothetical protein
MNQTGYSRANRQLAWFARLFPISPSRLTQMGELIAIIGGALIFLTATLVWGACLFQPMRTSERIWWFFSSPLSAMLGAITAYVGYSSAGYGDLPDGFDRWFFPVMFGTFGVGVILGIKMRASGVSSPAIAATEISVMKICPQCAEKVQGAALVCRFCRHAFDAPYTES